MCTILFSFGQEGRPPLTLLANRDEFYERPTRKADWWPDEPEVFAGRDLVGGGTWLGISKNGGIAAVTNFRHPGQERGELSRGKLVADYLRSGLTPDEYLANVERDKARYTGFNLLVGKFGPEGNRLFYFSNRGNGIAELEPGLYGLSNHLLDTPWPKVTRGKERFESLLESGAEKEEMFALLADGSLAEDDELPDTGIGYEKEKLLSAIFIETPVYGTRCSNVVIFRAGGGFEFEERVFV
ncbi:MAG: NRDE family protein [Acidobacteriota bacterium]|nr:MAG: NRDE family protein [Acidobacteriota bacterium]